MTSEKEKQEVKYGCINGFAARRDRGIVSEEEHVSTCCWVHNDISYLTNLAFVVQSHEYENSDIFNIAKNAVCLAVTYWSNAKRKKEKEKRKKKRKTNPNIIRNNLKKASLAFCNYCVWLYSVNSSQAKHFFFSSYCLDGSKILRVRAIPGVLPNWKVALGFSSFGCRCRRPRGRRQLKQPQPAQQQGHHLKMVHFLSEMISVSIIPRRLAWKLFTNYCGITLLKSFKTCRQVFMSSTQLQKGWFPWRQG